MAAVVGGDPRQLWPTEVSVVLTEPENDNGRPGPTPLW